MQSKESFKTGGKAGKPVQGVLRLFKFIVRSRPIWKVLNNVNRCTAAATSDLRWAHTLLAMCGEIKANWQSMPRPCRKREDQVPLPRRSINWPKD